MRNTLFGLALLLFAACSSSKTVHDGDTVVPDGDVPVVDDAVEAEADDFIFVEADELLTDADNVDCPPLATAPFPYYKDDGTIHFCRKCDTPTEKDPQCVQNLWKEANLKLSTDYPEYDCYPYPCDMPNLKARTMEEYYAEHPDAPPYVPMHSCDSILIPEGWAFDGSHGAIKHWNLSGGKAGFILDGSNIYVGSYPADYKVFLFDLQTKSYRAQGLSFAHGMTWYKGAALTIFGDARKTGVTPRYLGYFTEDGTYRVVYNKPIYLVGYTPAMNDKWVHANIQESETGKAVTMYAKVGEWKWTTLTTETNRHPSLQGDYLSVHTYDGSVYHGYVCDLSKYPTGRSQCYHVNRENEGFVLNIQFDEENPKRFVYTSQGFGRMAMVLVEMDDDQAKWKYTDILTDSQGQPDVANLYTYYIEQFRGDVILYHESGSVGADIASLACYFRLDTKKKYCMKKMENEIQHTESGTIMYVYGDAEFEGEWFLYQKINSTPFILRDMKCYCEKEGVCPFEGLKK